MVPKIGLGHLPDVGAAQLDGSGGHVVEPENQGGHGGLARTGAADDGGGLPPAADEIQVAQGVLLRVLKTEGYVPESEHLGVGGIRFGIFFHQVHNLRAVVQHQPDALAALQSAGQGEDHHLGHHQEEEHHHGVLNDGGDVADLEITRADVRAAEPVDHDHKEVDTEEGETVQIGEEAVGLDGGGGVIGEGGRHPLLFPRLVVKRPHDPHTGEVFQEDRAHAVEQLLERSEERRGAAHDGPGQQEHHDHHAQQDQTQLRIQPEGQRQRQQADKGDGDDHLNGAGEGKLDGGDIGDGAGGDGGGAEVPEVIDGELEGLGINGLPHVLADPGREGGAGIPA